MSWQRAPALPGATASGAPTPYQWRDRRWLACPSTRCARPGRSGHRPWNRKYHCRRLGKPAEPVDICCSSSVLSSYVARGRLAGCGKRLRSLPPFSYLPLVRERENIEEGSHRAVGRGRPRFYAGCYRHSSRLVAGKAFFRTLPGVLWSIDGVSRVECRRCAGVALWLRR